MDNNIKTEQMAVIPAGVEIDMKILTVLLETWVLRGCELIPEDLTRHIIEEHTEVDIHD